LPSTSKYPQQSALHSRASHPVLPTRCFPPGASHNALGKNSIKTRSKIRQAKNPAELVTPWNISRGTIQADVSSVRFKLSAATHRHSIHRHSIHRHSGSSVRFKLPAVLTWTAHRLSVHRLSPPAQCPPAVSTGTVIQADVSNASDVQVQVSCVRGGRGSAIFRRANI
jgi:hypothetical protein